MLCHWQAEELTMSALVSIIMPTFNRAYVINKAIDSVLKQTCKKWELIIVDDGSTDTTESLVKNIKDGRIRYHKQSNQGPSAARNKAVSLAKGEWIAYLDSDDVLYSNYLEVMLKWLDKNPKAVYAIPRAYRTLSLYKNGALIKTIDNSNDIPQTVTAKDIFMKRFHFSCDGFIHKRRIFNASIQWDPGLRHMEEWDLAMSIGEKYPEGFLYVPEVLYSYDQRHGADGVASNTTYMEWANAFDYIYQKHREDKMLKGQTWHPSRVEKWKKIAQDYEEGLTPPPHLYFFPEYFKPVRQTVDVA